MLGELPSCTGAWGGTSRVGPIFVELSDAGNVQCTRT